MKRKRLFLMLGVLALTVLLAGYSLAAGGAPSAETRYYYQLVPTENNSFFLYVGTDQAAMPLHAGSITLAAPATGDLSFDPESTWAVTSASYPNSGGNPIAGDVVTGTTTDGLKYISFSWYWRNDIDPPAQTAQDSFYGQLLGKVTVPGISAVDSIELLPWPETAIGAAQITDLNTPGTDTEGMLEIIESIWRMPDDTVPAMGYYQGYYAADRTEADTEGAQYPVDITARWQGFTIGAYAPERPATLLFYQHQSEGDPALYAVAETGFGQGTGHFKGRINFPELELKKPDGTSLDGGLTGIFDVVILKPSHVAYTLKGVTFVEGDCPGLQGVHAEIPCGDLVVTVNAQQQNLLRGDDVITLQDRSVLLSYLNGSLSDPSKYDYADLNGDGVVSLADLDILMSAENYNRASVIQVIGKEAGA